LSKPKVVKKRLIAILLSFTFLFSAMVVRVGYLQLVEGAEIKGKASVQQSSSQIINANRGNIYDRNGTLLAVSAPVQTVVANPKEIDKTKTDINAIAQGLSSIFGGNKDDIAKKLNSNTYFEVIKRKIDKDLAEKVNIYINENKVKGIYLVDDTKRFYPNNNIAAHVVGFTDADGHGLQGIEKSMEQYLQGLPGKVLSEVDASGRTSPFTSKEYFNSQDGLNAVLTIDNTIQDIAGKALDEAIKKYDVVGGGVAIVMDPKNGDVLAMVSKPDFDLNSPYKAPALPDVNAATWTGTSQKDVDLLNKTVWRNIAVSNTYEPGSTFKAITSAAALEEGAIHPEDPIDDSPVKMNDWTIASFQGYNYEGKIPFRLGLYRSSNPVFVRVSQLLGIDRFYSYMKAFGFYDKTGIELPGEQNSIIQAKPKEIDMMVAAFGQRFNVTPIQVASAYTAIANGGKLMKPRIVKELTDVDGNVVKTFEPEVVREVISAQTSNTLRGLLEGVVSDGSGSGAYIKGYRVAGKTGTSQTTDSDVYVASFSGMAPADDPVIDVLVTLFNPRGESYFGGMVAAPVAGSIIDQTLHYMGVEKRYTEKELKEEAGKTAGN